MAYRGAKGRWPKNSEELLPPGATETFEVPSYKDMPSTFFRIQSSDFTLKVMPPEDPGLVEYQYTYRGSKPTRFPVERNGYAWEPFKTKEIAPPSPAYSPLK